MTLNHWVKGSNPLGITSMMKIPPKIGLKFSTIKRGFIIKVTIEWQKPFYNNNCMDNKQPISFESIGRDYRDNYAKYRKKRIVIQSILSVIIALLITSFFLMCFLSAGYAKEDIFPICLLIFPLLVIAFVIILIFMTLKRNKELKKSDEWLGKKY